MIFERTIMCFLYTAYPLHFRMVVPPEPRQRPCLFCFVCLFVCFCFFVSHVRSPKLASMYTLARHERFAAGRRFVCRLHWQTSGELRQDSQMTCWTSAQLTHNRGEAQVTTSAIVCACGRHSESAALSTNQNPNSRPYPSKSCTTKFAKQVETSRCLLILMFSNPTLGSFQKSRPFM